MRGRIRDHEQVRTQHGFTLIELAIVLVIIGLVVGGILTGRSLINAAYSRAQISQIEKYNQAVNTFYGKFGALPGDLSPTLFTQFGFTAGTGRSGVAGDGDGNGELDGTNGTAAYAWDQGGELVYFWEDLTANAHLIDANSSSAAGPMYAVTCTSAITCNPFFPSAKIGNGAFVYVYSGYAGCGVAGNTKCGPNYFGISCINSISLGNVTQGATPPAPALTVNQAAGIDTKIDDGLPKTGNVVAQYLSGAGGPNWSTHGGAASATTCYDTSSGIAAYSVSYLGGNNVNCGLSFQMQGAGAR